MISYLNMATSSTNKGIDAQMSCFTIKPIENPI